MFCLLVGAASASCSAARAQTVPQKKKDSGNTISSCYNPFLTGLTREDSLLLARPFDSVQIDREPYLDIQELQKRVTEHFPKLSNGKKEYLARIRSRYTVRVRALIDRNGKCAKTVIERTDSDIFITAAEKAIQEVQFVAACRQGESISAWTTIPIVFVVVL